MRRIFFTTTASVDLLVEGLYPFQGIDGLDKVLTDGALITNLLRFGVVGNKEGGFGGVRFDLE